MSQGLILSWEQNYLGVIPGSSGRRTSRFTGLETPLLMTEGDDTEIRIRFPAGEGLEVGDPIKYRGIKVGEVVGIQLENDLQSVTVSVRLVGSAQKLARLGTQFWIERPRLDLTEIRGIDTLIAGKYIALQPTSNDGPLTNSFEGLSEPPPLPRREGSLEVELDSPQRMGIVRGLSDLSWT
ncbi:MAG: MlaD family protein [Pirellulales bacterium]